MISRIPLILFAVLLFGSWQDPASVPSPNEISSTLKELSAITGFKIRRQLPFQMVTREDVNKFVAEKIRKTVKPDEIRAEELTLKKFGFAPPEFDLKKTTIDLLTEQAAAFYDYDRKKLFISDWAAKNMRDSALIHELAHALADQNYSISKFLKAKSSEESSAREAVVEGQASWLMLEVVARRSGSSLREPATAKQFLEGEQAEPGESYPVFDKAPLYLQRTLLFPYDDGIHFQQAVFLHDGTEAFAKLFTNPPTSTAQVIHTDRYFNHVPFVSPELPKPVKPYKAYTAGTLGELETAVLIEQYAGKSTAKWLAPKLKGGAFRIDEAKPDRRSTLVYISEWADDDSAKAYFEVYAKVLSKKWKSVQMLTTEANQLTGKSEEGYFELVRNGVKVQSREGFPDAFAQVVTASLRF